VDGDRYGVVVVTDQGRLANVMCLKMMTAVLCVNADSDFTRALYL
jgi:hypothetical protein